MRVTKTLINQLAELAKLKFDKHSLEKMKVDLNTILAFVNKLSEINTKDIEPLIYLSEETNVLREDIVVENIDQKNALKNAPNKDSDYFKVPTVLKKKS